MTQTTLPSRGLSNHPFFSFGFRPFFLLASLWAVIVLPLWVVSFQMGLNVPALKIDVFWHVHEMVFGYGGAVIAGFLLTAVPNWTGRSPMTGTPLIFLVVLWGLGRIAYVWAITPDMLAAGLDSTFLIVLSTFVWREVLTSNNHRNIKVAAAVTSLALANLAFHAAALFDPGMLQQVIRLGLGVLLFLVLLIGGRITPAFTRNWLKQNSKSVDVKTGKFDDVVLVVSALGLAGWIILPDHPATSLVVVVAGGLTLVRMSRWCGLATVSEPLLFVLHIAYIWSGVAFLIVGAGGLFPTFVPSVAGTHAIGAGAIGVMTIAVMARATLGHTGRPLKANPSIVFMFICINLAALLRVVGAFAGSETQMHLNAASAVFWVLGFLSFGLVFGPMMVRKRLSATS